MKIVVTYLLVCVLETFCTKNIESFFDVSELENILDSIKLEDLFKYINEKRVKECSQKQQKDVRFKRNGCDKVKFTLPAIPRLRKIDAESVAAPVVITASSYIWRPQGRCGECPDPNDKSDICQHTKIDMKGLNECESKEKAGCKKGDGQTPGQATRNKKKKIKSKEIGLGTRRLHGMPKNGTRSKKSIEHPHIGLRTKAGRFLKGDLGSLKKKPQVAARMFSETVQNKNVEAEMSLLQSKKKTFGIKASDPVSMVQNRNITSKKLKGMQKVPKKLKSARKRLKVDLNYYDGDNGLVVLDTLMKQFLTRFKSKSPHLAGKLKEAFKKFIEFNLIQKLLDSYKSSKRKMLAKPKSNLEDRYLIDNV